MANKNLTNAKNAKNDEFYTQLSDIEKELKHYKAHFKDKIVYLNADDPFESNFFKYFASNFNMLGLKKLIATSYKNEQEATKIEITELDDYNNDGAINIGDVEYLLENDNNTRVTIPGNGDFRSDACVELLQEADIVVTNPPFSLFREYIAQLMEYNKKFLVIGNMNAITYKEIFPLIKNGDIWLGVNSNKTLEFKLPDSYTKWNKIENGSKYGKVPAITWYTNLEHHKRNEKLILYKKYNAEEYPKYDNYDAIEVSKTKDIPIDYNGAMGVPISFLTKYNPEQFDILGIANSARWIDYECLTIIDGKKIYNRIIIKHKI